MLTSILVTNCTFQRTHFIGRRTESFYSIAEAGTLISLRIEEGHIISLKSPANEASNLKPPTVIRQNYCWL